MVEGAEPFEWRTGALCFKPKNPVLKTHSIAGEARDHLEPGDCLLELRKSEKKKEVNKAKDRTGEMAVPVQRSTLKGISLCVTASFGHCIPVPQCRHRKNAPLGPVERRE